MLTPPFHYSIVACPPAASGSSDEVLYRGSIPVRRNIAFLDRLRVRTLLYLRKKELDQDDPVSVWAALRGVDLKWVKAEHMSEEKLGMGKSEVGEVMRTILDRSAYPLYIGDVDGISHTTLVVACLRKMQGWHIDSIIGEICRCVGCSHLEQQSQPPTRAELTTASNPNTKTTPSSPSSRPTSPVRTHPLSSPSLPFQHGFGPLRRRSRYHERSHEKERRQIAQTPPRSCPSHTLSPLENTQQCGSASPLRLRRA